MSDRGTSLHVADLEFPDVGRWWTTNVDKQCLLDVLGNPLRQTRRHLSRGTRPPWAKATCIIYRKAHDERSRWGVSILGRKSGPPTPIPGLGVSGHH